MMIFTNRKAAYPRAVKKNPQIITKQKEIIRGIQ